MNPWTSGWREQAAYWIAERAYFLHTEGRFHEALTLFEGLASLDPGNLYYKDCLCALHLALGGWREAERRATEVLAQEPGNVNALVRRCEARLMLVELAPARDDLDRIQATGNPEQARRMEMRLAQLLRPRFASAAGQIRRSHATLPDPLR